MDASAGGVWSSPAIDESDGSVYITTGNPGDCPPEPSEPYTEAVLKLRATDLGLIDAYQIPPVQAPGDSDFGATPTLFTAVVGGETRSLVGAMNKNATFYAFDRSDLAAGPIWQRFFGTPGVCESCLADFFAPASFDGSALYVAGDAGVIDGNSCVGSLSALDPATGGERWARCLPDGRVLGAVITAPGIVEVNEGATAMVVAAASGVTLLAYTEPSGNYFWGPAYIDAGVLYVANNDGNLLAFSPTSSTAPIVPEAPAAIVLPLSIVLGSAIMYRRCSVRRRREEC